MSSILVFGASGQLGQCLKKVAEIRGISAMHFLSKQEADILDLNSLKSVFEKYKPTWCINCAAYTAVDKAEDDINAARNINKTGVGNISILCQQYKTTLIHISTDFVFKGDKAFPLAENNMTEPIGIYGLTKLEGEKAIAAALEKYFILRTSWLYSEYGNNFVKTMLKLGAERDQLKIIADQVGTPTYAMDLAEVILNIILKEVTDYGVYHYSNEGVASWYDFAKAIFDISGTKIKVLPIKTSEYPTRAARPAYSVMDKSKIKQTFNMEIPYWHDSLVTCLGRLNR